MNDPHVASITYRVLWDESITFEDAPELVFQTPEFDGRLGNDILTLTPRVHFPSEADARAIADELIRAWEISAGIDYGRPDFKLRFEGAQIVDRAPQPGHVAVHLSDTVYLHDEAHVRVIHCAYPPPPPRDFVVGPEVEVMWERYCRYVAGEEPLLSMAYFCLTLLERGDRGAAAAQFAIGYTVLTKLGELTSTRGDPQTARKMSAQLKPLAASERAWIEGAIKAIMRHLAMRPPGRTLRMADLPQI